MAALNLINDPWIPVRTRSGQHRWIAPWQITEGLEDDPIVAVDAPRADFTGALHQFLIGLFQTAIAPKRESEWVKKFNDPPTSEFLKSELQEYSEHFEFGPEGPSFMEELGLEVDFPESLDGLFLDAPGISTRKKNIDFFVKRDQVGSLSPQMAAAAIFTLQLFAPGGGRGRQTCIRKVGPLSTLVVSPPKSSVDTLWHNSWWNVLPQQTFEYLGASDGDFRGKARFPWLNPAKTSENDKTVTPEEAHASTLYWACPRRIRLRWQAGGERNCDVSGITIEHAVIGMVEKSYGSKFRGAWHHPLSPYGEDGKLGLAPLRVSASGISYRYWLGIDWASKNTYRPAQVVERAESRVLENPSLSGVIPHIWAFGFDIVPGKSTARCWYDSRYPLYYVRHNPERLHQTVKSWVTVAGLAANYLRKACRDAWSPAAKSESDDTTRRIADLVWQSTESRFYTHMRRLIAELDGDNENEAEQDRALQEISASWRAVLRDTVIGLFDQWAGTGYFEAEDPRRIATAYTNLQKNLNGPKLNKLLGLRPSKKAA